MHSRPYRHVAVVAFASTAYIGAFTAGALAAPMITGERATSGWPNAIGIAATALAASLLSLLMARRGRRAGLVLGFGIGIVGAIAAVVSVAAGSLLLLLAASAALGVSNGAIQLTRYAASDLVAPQRRAAVIATVVWGSTAGAVFGPNLLGPAAGVATAFGFGRLEGAFGLVVVGMAAAFLIAWTLPSTRPPEPAAGDTHRSRRELLAEPRVRTALIGMVAGQVVMGLLMTMTPLHVQESGHDIGIVGIVISAHTLGMFALSPLSGMLVARLGAMPTMLAGFGVLGIAGITAAIAPHDGVPILALALFLLGFGWSLTFVAGSSLLASGGEETDRVRLQGTADAIIWSSAAAASISAGALLDAVGYSTLGVITTLLLALPLFAILFTRRGAIGSGAGATS